MTLHDDHRPQRKRAGGESMRPTRFSYEPDDRVYVETDSMERAKEIFASMGLDSDQIRIERESSDVWSLAVYSCPAKD